MRLMSSVVLLFFLGLFLSACSASIPVVGETKAGNVLKSDVSRNLAMWSMATVKCDRIDSIETKVVSANPIGTGGNEMSRKYGSVDERWLVRLCGESIPFSVSFTPDGKGGTFFNISREVKEL